jgi:phosphoribosylaminoimidazole carboxylase (NCAIR synthetase)
VASCAARSSLGLSAADHRARDIAGRIADALDYIGVLAVEMFHLGADARKRSG